MGGPGTPRGLPRLTPQGPTVVALHASEARRLSRLAFGVPPSPEGWSIVVAIRRKSTTPPSGRRVYESAGVSPPPRARGDVAVDAVLAVLGLHAGGLRRRRAGLGMAAEHLGDGCLRRERATRRALPTGRATAGPVAAGCMGPEGRAATGRCSLPLASRICQRDRQSPGGGRSGSARVGRSAGCRSGTVAGCRSIRRFPGCSTRLQSPGPDV